MNSVLRHITALCCVLLFVIYTSAQQQPAGADTASPREVTVTVKVTSNSQGTAHGLTKDDFKLAVAGKQRPVLSAEELADHGPADKAVPASNNLSGLERSKRLVVILLDEPNMMATAGTEVYQQMAKSISSLPKGEVNFMVLLVDLTGIHLAHEITDDPSVLSDWLSKKDKSGIQVLKNQAPAASRAVSSLDDILATYFIRTSADYQYLSRWTGGGSSSSSVNRVMVRKAIITVDAMQQAVQALAGIPGQRSLVWVTGQVPFNFHHSEKPKEEQALPPEFLNTMSSLDRAGIDLALIETYLGSHGSSTSNFAVGLTQADRYGRADVLTGSMTNATMTAGTFPVLNDFAKAIGSKVYADPGMLGKAISEITKEQGATYRVRFTAETKEVVNGWIPAEISTNRAGTVVASRSGHYVSNNSDPLDTRIYDVRMAVRSPLQFTSLPVQASFGQMQPSTDGKRTVPFRVSVPANHMLCDEKKDNLVLADLAYQVVDADGKEVMAKVNPLKANLKPEQRDDFAAKGLSLDRSLELRPGAFKVRFIVRDNLSGKIGSVSIPLKVD